MTGQGAAPGLAWASRPRYAPADFVVMLWRERVLMAAVFGALCALGLAAAFSMKTTYASASSVLVRLGQEYVYEPRAGDAGRGAVPQTDQLIQAEIQILGSDLLKQRVIDRLGVARIAPEAAAKYAKASPADKRVIAATVLRGMAQATKIETAPDTPVIRVAYKHRNPDTAALVVNTLLEEYLVHRREVLLDPDDQAIEQQRQVFAGRLASADAAYEGFLTNHRIGDFVAEKASLSQLQAQIEQQKLQTESQLAERVGRLATLDTQLRQVSPEVGLYRDVSAAPSDRLVQMKVQREEFLSRYKPDAKPVQDLEAQIAQLERGIAQGRAAGDGARRLGANPVYQTLQSDRIQVAADVAALRRSQGELAAQLDQLVQRRLKIAELEPDFQALSLDRDVLQANVRDFAVKEAQNRAAQELAQRTNDNIRIIERAVPAAKGQSLKRPVAVLALMFAGFTALSAGLLRAFLRPGLPTPASAERTLGLPVLAAASLRRT